MVQQQNNISIQIWYHCSWTTPMTHYGYNKWWCTVEIGIYQLEASPSADFWFVAVTISGDYICLHFSYQSLWELDHTNQTTAAGPPQWLIMGIMNGDALLRLESINWKHLHQLIFEVLLGTKWQLAIGTYHPNHCIWTTPMTHYRYNEWWCTVEIGIYQLEASLTITVWLWLMINHCWDWNLSNGTSRKMVQQDVSTYGTKILQEFKGNPKFFSLDFVF